MNARPNIVLIHGAWAEGSGWSGVIARLLAGGYDVTVPPFPLTRWPMRARLPQVWTCRRPRHRRAPCGGQRRP